jgi:NADH-quinone oxidoreductase subunit G
LSAPELVTVTVDGVEIQVAKGTGIVETALAGGIEIPVFCYEPRLGPAVGACRMCLCEVEGMPKAQAACTLAAQDGMVVHTAATSAKAAEAQEGVLEFILVNHPLDCPICDKGGECPLQDLTFRYGPGNTRMTFPKRTFEKPIPISPTIALDRERCILCYRCTRFSEGVSEDGQLIARNRGAQSIIATFEDEPYRARFSGNVVELCPVGALTSTQYRFEARPWEIQNVPSVCGLCPVGCNITATTREGKVKRILSRNYPEVDDGWLCDKGRFAFSHLYARDRVRDPLRKAGTRRFEELAWDDALDEAERILRSGPVTVAFSGSETVEVAQAVTRLIRDGLRSTSALLPDAGAAELDAFRAPLSSIRDAKLVVVVGDEPVGERAPIVELWLRAARRAGAEVVTVGSAGTLQAAPGQAVEIARARLSKRLPGAVVIGSGIPAQELAALAGEFDVAAAFHLPATPNGRAVAESWGKATKGPRRADVLLISGDEAVSDPRVRALAEKAKHVIAIAAFADPCRGWVDLVLPGTTYLERDGTLVNLEGRAQRLRRAVIPPTPDELAWLSKLGERFDVAISPYPENLGAVGERAPLPPPAPRPASNTVLLAQAETAVSRENALRLVRYRPLFSGPAVERVPELEFQRPAAEVELAPEDASRLGVQTGDDVVVRSNGTSAALRARVNRRLVAGVVRAADEHVRGLGTKVEVTKA